MEEFKRDHTSWKLFLKRKFYFLHRQYLSFRKPKAPIIFFYPQLPGWKTSIHKILMHAGIGVTDDPDDSFDIAIYWEDRTFRNRRQQLEAIKDSVKIINYNCTDISKEKVEEVFEKIFGYNLRVSPESGGRILRKSNFNGMHDGEIIRGPVAEKEEGVVYERLLNNQLDNGLFEDIRLPYFNGIIPLISLRYHSKRGRFNTIQKATLAKVEKHLSREELQLIHRFCVKLGLEYGELDLIRDRNDQRLYIVDANPTPTVPPSKSMKWGLRRRMIRTWSWAFKEAFLDGL
jgi:hypothetical protein